MIADAILLACGHALAAQPAAADARAQLSIATSHRQGVTSLVWSADGKRLLTTSADNTARLWAVGNGPVARIYRALLFRRGLNNNVREAAFVSGGR